MEWKKSEKPLTARERLVIILTLFLIKMLNPWEYDHQFSEFWASIKENYKS